MAFTLDPQTGKITFGVVSDGTHDGVAIDLASQFGVSEDFNDDYTSDNWTDVGTGFGVNVPTAIMNVRGVKGPSINNNSSGIDLGAGNVSDTNFVLRFKFEFTSLPTIVTDDSALYLSIDSADQSLGANQTGHDALTLQIAKSTTTQNTRLVPFHSDGGAVIETVGTALLVNGIGPIYYIEIKRTSTTSATWTVFSDSTYTGVIATSTETIPVTTTGLRHIVWRSRSDGSSGAGEITAEIDDVQFWNAKSTPIIDSTTNWRIRYKLDITNLDDGANTTDKQLYMGLFDEDGISASDNAQDGYALLLSHDNTVSQFRVITPDNQAPRLATADATFATTPSVTTRFIELIRDSMSQTTTSIYSDATFTTLVEAEVVAGISGSDNLKYLKFMNDIGSNDTGAIDGTIDDITFIDLGAGIAQEIFDVDAILLATIDETVTVDSLLLATQSTVFTVDSTVVARTCSPWLNLANGDGSTQRLTRNGGGGQGMEFPLVNVDTFVTGFKIRLQRVGGASGAFNCKIWLYPPSQGSGGAMSIVGTSDNLSGVSIPSVLTETTATFDPPVKLSPGQRYIIGFSEGLDSGTGINYETRVTTDTQFQYAFQIPNTGSPPNWINLLTTDRQIAGDILVINGDASLCITVDAILTKVTAWQFREQRTRNDQAPSGGGPIITFSAEPPRFKIDSTTASIGFGWLFKTFLLSEITGSTIKADWAGTGTAQIRVYDGRYERTNFGDFIPKDDSQNPVAVTILKGAGLLGSIETIAPSSTTTLDGASINYAGALLDEVTVFIKLNDTSNAVAGNLNIASITVTGIGSVYNFDLDAPYIDPLTNIAPGDGWVTTDAGRMPLPSGGDSDFLLTKDGTNDTIAQDFSDGSRLGATLGNNWRLRLQVEFTNLATSAVPNDFFLSVSDENQTINAVTGSENSIGFRFRNVDTGNSLALYKKSGVTQTLSTIPSYNFTQATNFLEITRTGNTADIKVYSDATFTVVTDSVTGIDVTSVPTGQQFWKWGNDSNLVSGEGNITAVPGVVGLEISPSSAGVNLVQENTGTEFDWGFVDATSITDPSVDFEFAIDACVGLFAGRRSRIGDIILICLMQQGPLTGQEIVDHVNLFTQANGLPFVGKTSRVKNWIGFLESRGLITEDNSSPDWYKTTWTKV